MERANRILKHPLFQRELERIEVLEQERIFCRHGLEHLLEVARIAWIINLEEGLQLSADTVYGAAFLHDIGRGVQYETGRHHSIAGPELAKEILKDCGCEAEEIGMICDAIEAHSEEVETGELGRILHRADKLSRRCFGCEAREACYWPEEEKKQGHLEVE